MRFYVQHSAGLGKLVLEALRTDLGSVDVLFQDDSGLVFGTANRNLDRVASLSYAKNTFEVIDSVARGGIPVSIGQLIKVVRNHRSLAAQCKRAMPFRTMVNIDGQLVGLSAALRAQVVAVIAEQTGGRLNSRGGRGSVEFWIVGRRNLDLLLFCRRLSVGGNTGIARGSLTPDLATLLVKASQPSIDDVYLDPFAGSGAIIRARLDCPLRRAIYNDLRLDMHRADLPTQLTNSRKVEILGEDALVLPSIADGSVTTVVTDPPWGEHAQLNMPYENFATAMMTTLNRVLHPRDGRLVLLLGRQVAHTVSAAWGRSSLLLRDSYDILVNGHPASVLVGGR